VQVVMMTAGEPIPTYQELGDIAEGLFEESNDNPVKLATLLDRLDPHIRKELLVSDFLNAYQAFYYFFREEPGDLEKDRMILEPASSLDQGILIHEIDLFEVIFRVEDAEPIVSVGDGEQILANYRGTDAYRRAIRFIDENL
jgi:hypothetical protein